MLNNWGIYMSHNSVRKEYSLAVSDAVSTDWWLFTVDRLQVLNFQVVIRRNLPMKTAYSQNVIKLCEQTNFNLADFLYSFKFHCPDVSLAPSGTFCFCTLCHSTCLWLRSHLHCHRTCRYVLVQVLRGGVMTLAIVLEGVGGVIKLSKWTVRRRSLCGTYIWMAKKGDRGYHVQNQFGAHSPTDLRLLGVHVRGKKAAAIWSCPFVSTHCWV